MKTDSNCRHTFQNVSVSRMRQIERREWWLWLLVVIVTFSLTVGIAILALTLLPTQADELSSIHLRESVRGLIALVLIFDIYSLYQQFQIYSVRKELQAREELFRMITENIADMIAVVDEGGNRVYNSAAYTRVLGYSLAELQNTSSLEQVHPDDRARVKHAASQARKEGHTETLEYRIQHKDGSWRVLESIATVLPDRNGSSRNLIIVNRDITDRKRMEQQLQHNAFHDGLTNLPNRVLFLDRLAHSINRTKRRTEYKCAVLLLDIDDFKKINDSFGHSIGDGILVEITQRLTRSLRIYDTVSRSDDRFDAAICSDTLARLGGDEFTILLEDIRDAGDAIRVAARIQGVLVANPFVINEKELSVSCSVGIALHSPSHRDAEDLLRDAEIAMYRAKSSGKARYEVFDARMHELAVQRINLESAIRKGIERDEFRIVYQPIVRLGDTKIVGFEALARWECPGAGLLAPSTFIPVAEESGLIIPINRHLRIEACRRIRKWQTEFPSDPPLTLSLNVTAQELAYPALTKEIDQALQQTVLEPSCLHLEILETIAMREGESRQVLAEAKALGVRLSIDDFGSGYSSLSRLRDLPADTLKIDRMFVSQIDTSSDNHAIVHTILTLAHDFDLMVVAEGAETLQEVNALRNLGCGYAQGYYFSPPVAEETAMQLLQAQHLQN